MSGGGGGGASSMAHDAEAGTLASLKFTDSFVSTLPGDVQQGGEPRPVRDAAYSFVKPTPPSKSDQAGTWAEAFREGAVRVPAPPLKAGLVAWSEKAGELLGIKKVSDDESFECKVLGGFGMLCAGMRPYAANYGGHQFGSWAGQLGDGRAITLGECNGWELQLKGAGKTPYSRFADGRAVMRSSVREFLCSEAMHGLGVPTTRALSLVATGTGVVRDMFYSGEPRLEAGAVCARLAPTFLRLGSFQLPASRSEFDLLRAIADYAIDQHFPEIDDGDYAAFVRQVALRNARMVAMWQGVGFVHGVMNTDNFSILGLTIDYGPYGFLDEYDPDYTPNTTDFGGKRYKYESQPDVGRWNIWQFAQAMVPLTSVHDMQSVVDEFAEVYAKEYDELFARKLGIAAISSEEDRTLLNDWLELLREHKMDWTNSWRALSDVTADMVGRTALDEVLRKAKLLDGLKTVNEDKWVEWLDCYVARVTRDEDSGAMNAGDREKIMKETNPVYILRNYMAQMAIEKAEQNDYSEVRRLLQLVQKPYQVQDGMERYTLEPPDWALKRGVKVNSCSS